MAVGTTAAVAMIAGGAAFSAGSSIMGSRQEATALSQQANFNAGIYEQQAAMIGEQQRIAKYQYGRKIGRMRSSIVSATAGKGLEFTGSPLRIMADNESQLLFDQAINNYNLEVQKNYYQHGAAMTRYQGELEASTARRQGYQNAFSTILNAGTTFASMGAGGAFKPSGTSYSSYNSQYGTTRMFGGSPLTF